MIAWGNWQIRTNHVASTSMRALVTILANEIGVHNLSWAHVNGHSGHPWNEMCDRLAQQGANMNIDPNF